MKIGLYFGTFNPIHVGHLIIANHFAEHSDLDQVWCVVTPQNPHKTKQSNLDNVEGVVISIAKRDGVRLDEKPWSMVNLHIWDGAHVAEVVAFGSSITNQITDLSPLDRIKIVSAELGWRSSLPQLRIDQRSTRLTKID